MATTIPDTAGQKSSSGRLPVMSPNPVSRVFADYDADLQGLLQLTRFTGLMLSSVTLVANRIGLKATVEPRVT